MEFTARTLKNETSATFIGGNFSQEIQNQLLEVCGGIIPQNLVSYAFVSLTGLVLEISAKNLIFTGHFFRQKHYNSANKSKSPTAGFYLPLYIVTCHSFISLLKPSYFTTFSHSITTI
jgi:hypothetical protein